ncbi:hypothetical protein OAG51_00485 [Pirellulaceae bacterium]|jgi:hypothetical protein|nr:hypothetical protein [Pirellulaceae bacterium]
MKKFSFSLDSVLNIEQQLDQMIDIRLAEAKGRLNAAMDVLVQMKNAFVEQEELLRQEDHRSLQVVCGWDVFQRRTQMQMESQTIEIQKRRREFQNVLHEKLKRNQRIEGLRKLEENEKKKFITEQNRKQQGLILDAVLLKKNRRHNA